MVGKDRRIRIFTGHYGSGKTEVSVNYALQLSRLRNKKIAFADMDIVNPYFRSREVKETLNKSHIRTMDSSVNTSVELPSIPAEMYTPFQDKSYEYIIDLGGNDVGLAVLGRYQEYLNKEAFDFFMVVNAYRPDTDSVKHILFEKKKLEAVSGYNVTGLINNTNLVRETKFSDILYGDTLLKEVSRETGVPIKYTTYMKQVIPQFSPEEKRKLSGELLPLLGLLRQSWM